jgi:RNA polymerase sigma-70 factor (ECF subfamily)
MTETTWALLRNLLVDRYGHFQARLTRHFGSRDLANETLHETWLHLHRQGDAGSVHSPPAFLMRIAKNIAKDRQRAEQRRARNSEIKAALEIADPAPSPEQAVQDRRDFEIMERAILELPDRMRAILIASRIEGLAHQEIANRLEISRRTVFYELKRAVAYLETRIENNEPPNCTYKPPESS